VSQESSNFSRIFFPVFKRDQASTPITKEDSTNRLTNQFYITLLSSYDRIEARNGSSNPPLSKLTEVKKLLEETPRTWRTAYHIEQLLIHHYDDYELEMEIERLLVDAQKLLARDVYDSYKKAKEQINGKQTNPELDAEHAQRKTKKAVLLGRLTNDLQWKSEINEAGNEFRRQLMKRTGWFFIGVFVLFLIYVIAATNWLLAGIDNATLSEVVLAANAKAHGQPVFFYFFTIGLAILAGCLGACFSMLTGSKSRLQQSTLDDLKILNTISNLSTRVLIGICAGIVVFFFIRSGLLTGPLVPDLLVKTGETYDLFQVMALLVVWSFLAGFSEKLVPELLFKTEAQASIVGNPPPPSIDSQSSGQAKVIQPA
jgi:hypothetical protein